MDILQVGIDLGGYCIMIGAYHDGKKLSGLANRSGGEFYETCASYAG